MDKMIYVVYSNNLVLKTREIVAHMAESMSILK